MRKILRPLVVLHGDRLLREQLRAIARKHALELRIVADWEVLLEEVRAAPTSAFVIVDPYAGEADRSQPSIELGALLNRFPSLTVTAALTAGRGRLEHVRRLGEWGVVQVIDLEEETTALAIWDRLQSSRGRSLVALIERALTPASSGTARAILRAATVVVSDGGQGRELAQSLHVTPRTLLRWCRNAGLPATRPLLAWMRILLAAELLDDPGRTVSDVALSCGYSSDSTLRQALRTFLRLTPTQLRERGAFETASSAFLRSLAEARSSTKRYRGANTAKAPGG